MSTTLNNELYTYLTADVGVFAAVGLRIFPLRAPTNAVLPYIVYQRIDDIGRHHYRGADGMPTASWQVDVWGPHTPGATINDAAEAVRLALDGFQGTMGTLVVRSSLLERQRDDLADASDGSENFKWRISMDFSITYRRSVTNFF